MTKPIVVRQDGTLGPAGLKQVEDMAAAGKSRRTIAAALGVSHKKFEKMLERNKGENPERLAWERGFATIEQRVSDTFLASGTGELVEEEVTDPETGETKMEKHRVVSKGGLIGLMFYAKSQLGWTDKPTGALVQDNRIQITLPAPMSTEEFYKTMGIDGPLDFRKANKGQPHPLLPGSGPAKVVNETGLPAAATPKEPTNGK